MYAIDVFWPATVALAASAAAQTANPEDLHSAASIMTEEKALVAKGMASPDGLALEKFESYPGHFSELIARVKSGGDEVHAADNDYFIVEEGEADVLVGGTVVDPKETTPGETRGTKVEGGTPHHIGKGDLLHISPGVPHQTTVPAGKVFVYLVVKVAKPS